MDTSNSSSVVPDSLAGSDQGAHRSPLPPHVAQYILSSPNTSPSISPDGDTAQSAELLCSDTRSEVDQSPEPGDAETDGADDAETDGGEHPEEEVDQADSTEPEVDQSPKSDEPNDVEMKDGEPEELNQAESTEPEHEISGLFPLPDLTLDPKPTDESCDKSSSASNSISGPQPDFYDWPEYVKTLKLLDAAAAVTTVTEEQKQKKRKKPAQNNNLVTNRKDDDDDESDGAALHTVSEDRTAVDTVSEGELSDNGGARFQRVRNFDKLCAQEVAHIEEKGHQQGCFTVKFFSGGGSQIVWHGDKQYSFKAAVLRDAVKVAKNAFVKTEGSPQKIGKAMLFAYTKCLYNDIAEDYLKPTIFQGTIARYGRTREDLLQQLIQPFCQIYQRALGEPALQEFLCKLSTKDELCAYKGALLSQLKTYEVALSEHFQDENEPEGHRQAVNRAKQHRRAALPDGEKEAKRVCTRAGHKRTQ